MVIHTLSNGRQYRVIDTGKPYQNGEYPSGGFVIHHWLAEFDNPQWVYVDNSPDQECVDNFLKACEKLPPLVLE